MGRWPGEFRSHFGSIVHAPRGPARPLIVALVPYC